MEILTDWLTQKTLQVDAIYSSSSLRSIQSARILAKEYDIDYKRTIYLGVFYQNNFLPDMTNHKRFGFPVGDLTFHDGNVRWNHIALRLGVVF